MKKLVLTAILSVTSTWGFAQGFINFFGGASKATRMSTNNLIGSLGTGLTAGNTSSPLFYYAVFASSVQSSINGSTSAITGYAGPGGNYVFNNLGGGTASTGWVLVGLGTNTQNVGRYAAMSQGPTPSGQGALNADGSMTVQGIAGGGTAYVVVVGWEAADIGTTLPALEAWYATDGFYGFLGQSAVATVQLGDGLVVPTPNPFGTGLGQVSGFVIGWPAPEPGTLALAALGGASLLLFRRKK